MKTFKLSLVVLFILACSSLFAVHTEVQKQGAVEQYIIHHEITAEDFLNLKVKEIKSYTNKKVTLKERIVLGLTKLEVKNHLRNGEEVDAEYYYKRGAGNFNLGGFLLGLFLPIIGNLIAILFGRNAFRSSLKGTLVAIILWALGIYSFF